LQTADRRFEPCPRLRWQGFARQSFTHGLAQRLDASDFGSERGIGSNSLRDDQRIYGIKFTIEIGLDEQ
jgi:hypothetical protein